MEQSLIASIIQLVRNYDNAALKSRNKLEAQKRKVVFH